MDDEAGLRIAIEEAEKGLSEGGVPIGAVLVSATGKLLGRCHNQNIQRGSVILHAEMATFDAAGRVSKATYRGSTLYTTLTPCLMCTGAVLWFGVGRVVMGEARSVDTGGHAVLVREGVQVVDMDDGRCYEMLQKFMKEFPEKWRFD